MNVLAFGAHPDDIELGCAGTLLKHRKAGRDVYLCVMCDGREAGNPEERIAEQEAAAKRLGAKELIWGGFADTKLEANRETIQFVEDIVKKVNPYEIYVNYDNDTHQDHRTLAQCVVAATRYNKRVLYYEDYTSHGFQPDIFVDIEDVLDQKVNVMGAFHSQMNKESPAKLRMLDGITAIANFRGFQAKVKYAEGFKAIRYLKLDINEQCL